MQWLLGGKKKRGIDQGFVGVCETPSGIAMAYTIPSLQAGNAPIIKAQAFVATTELEKKQVALIHFVEKYQLHNLPCTNVIPIGQYQLILLEAPPLNKSEFSKAAVWLLKDILSFPTEEAIIDTFELPAHRARDNVKMMYAAVIHKNSLSAIQALTQAAKLRLTTIDIPELAVSLDWAFVYT